MEISILKIRPTQLVLLISTMLYSVTAIGQTANSYNARLNLASVDTVSRVACYDIEISNGGSTEWVIGSYNLGIFYDARAGCYVSDSLISDDIVYAYGLTHQISSTNASDLPYRDSIGFLRVSLSPEDQPASLDSLRDLMDTLGTWIPTIRVCFDLKFTEITSPETCLRLDFSTPALQAALGQPTNIMQEWAGAFVLIDVTPNTLSSVLPNRSRNSCFVLEENTPDLCSDGIDNDEDGLTDCMDTDGCSPGILAIRVGAPTCFDSLGSFTVGDGVGDGLMYSNDGGVTFQDDSTFTDLAPGVYSVLVQRHGITLTGCVFETPVILMSPICDEISNEDCGNGTDDDNDGLMDCDDPDCRPFINEVIAIPPDNCPSLDNGTISMITTYPDASYSIDDGTTFSTDNTFSGLGEGDYTIIIRNEATGCIADTMPMIRLTANPPCPTAQEQCSDNIDNDNDGLIDCQDPDCNQDPRCEPIVTYYIPNVMDRQSMINARFQIHTPDTAPLGIQQLNIYDRYGNLIFNRNNTSTVDLSHTWDGSYNNTEVAAGVYIYQAILTQDGFSYNISGDITILQ